MAITLPCIICGAALEPATPFEENQPYAGTTFATRGHYGSTVFDPMNGDYLQINICDPCIQDRAQQQRILLCPPHKSHLKPEIWNGNG